MTKKQLFSMLVMAGLFTAANSAFAASDTKDTASTQDTEQLLKKMTQQTQALETQMTILKKQIHQLRAQQRHLAHRQLHPVSTFVIAAPKQLVVHPTANTNLKGQLAPISEFTPSRVTIAPYLGDHLAFNAADLVVNYSSYNEDLSLLQLRDRIASNQAGSIFPSLLFSGKLEARAIYQKPYTNGHTSKFDLSGAEIDVIPMINRWANGFIGIKYDNSAPAMGPVVSNSRVYLDRAFLTIGNLNCFPLYMSFGQLYVPFGSYSSNLIASPVTESIFQTKARALVVGYDHQGIYGQIYGFGGDTHVSNPGNINNLGANIGFSINRPIWNLDAGLGAITNVADSLGMQNNAASGVGFSGFGETLSPITHELNHLQRQVPGIAGHLNFGVEHFGVNSEYITATSSFAYQDMNFDGAAAKPHALHAEAYYNFHLFNKPSAVTVGYDHSWDALALNVPERAYTVNLATSIWRDTVEQIEFSHAQNYSVTDNAAGFMVPVSTVGLGGTSNTVTAQIGIYF